MGISQIAVALFFASACFAIALANVVYTSPLLKGSVTCADCPRVFDLSGLQVLVKCDKVKKLVMTYTQRDGSFETELPSDGNNPESSDTTGKCLAKIMGGSLHLYIPTNTALIPVAKSNESGHYYFTLSNPLTFYRTCPPKAKCDAKDLGFLGASEADNDVPHLPGQGEVPPPTNYIPFMPILGIP